MKISTHIQTVFVSLLVLLLCSCQSSSIAPLDPFSTYPTPEVACETADAPNVPPATTRRTPPPVMSVPFESISKESITDPAPAFYAPETGNHRLVQDTSAPNGIVQVAFVQEEGDSSSPAKSCGAELHDLSVEPELAQHGATVIARHREGRQEFQGPWRPQNMPGFWPQAEYLADGGDDGGKVFVEEDWTVHNLENEDTVAHFDTLDGRTLVEASNRVHIYSPRFGAVRKVEGLVNSGQITTLSATNGQMGLDVGRTKEQLGYTAQETQTGYARTRHQLGGIGSRKASTGAAGTQGLGAYSNFETAMLYSNLLKQRSIGSAELAYLAEGSAGARAWQGTEGIKVRINVLAPMAATSEEGAESFFQIEEDESKTSKLRLIKVASRKDAQPGETVEFTLRFDNVGNQVIGNVTILDNLTTRLEFLPGTAKSSLKSGFAVQPNDTGSFTLRFEITAPLEPGQFGIVQFQCRVR